MRKFLVLLCMLSLIALAGCGPPPRNAVRSGFDDNADYVKMTQINRDALLRGYRIVWVHAPQKEPPKPTPNDG
jgi:hypothetical protein